MGWTYTETDNEHRNGQPAERPPRLLRTPLLGRPYWP